MEALVLAAGYGTRMGNIPKMFVEVESGKPAVSYNLRALTSAPSIDRISVVTNNLYFDRFRELAAILSLDKKIRIVSDCTASNDERLGSVGDIAFVITELFLQDEVYVVQGDDITTRFDPEAFITYQRKKQSTVIVIHDKPREKLAGRFGVVEVDENYRLTGIEEKPEEPKTNLANGGYYIIAKNDLRKIIDYVRLEQVRNQERHTPVDKTGLLWKHLLKKGSVIHCFPYPGNEWFDIGTPETLEEARKSFAEFNKQHSR